MSDPFMYNVHCESVRRFPNLPNTKITILRKYFLLPPNCTAVHVQCTSQNKKLARIIQCTIANYKLHVSLFCQKFKKKV